VERGEEGEEERVYNNVGILRIYFRNMGDARHAELGSLLL
jgi:hypothetical protein